MQTRNAPWYKHQPIATVAALARALGVTPAILQEARLKAPSAYYRRERPKPGGGVRVTYRVAEPLKGVQQRILHRLLREVELPLYLLGGRPGADYLTNVRWHCGAKILFGEDVSSFFPSIRPHHVRSVFVELMHFSPVVAECLTELCIFQNHVPQGAHTSGDLANLVFWRQEPALVVRFTARGLRYTRFVDDVYVSAQEDVTPTDKTWIVGELHRMFVLQGFAAKRKKHELSSSGGAMRVHRVSINAGRPSINASERANLRAAMHELLTTWNALPPPFAERQLARLRGRIARLKHLHPAQHDSLSHRLMALPTQPDR
jgi:hypothetical protein